MEENTTIPFRFEWLQQLISVVDFLNLELGIMHQDIAPRNIFIDSETQGIRLFDFDRAARGKLGLLDGRDDVSGVICAVYEIITGNQEHAEIPHWEREVRDVHNLPEWPVRRELDTDVSTFRNFLNEWVANRKAKGDMDLYLSVPQLCEWPDMQEAEDLPLWPGRRRRMDRLCRITELALDVLQLQMGNMHFDGRGRRSIGCQRRKKSVEDCVHQNACWVMSTLISDIHVECRTSYYHFIILHRQWSSKLHSLA